MTLDRYFEIIKPRYIYLKLTPLKSIRNYESDKILKTVGSLYRALADRIRIENKKLFFTASIKVAYYIVMEKGNIEFYFIIPEAYQYLLRDKISDTWKGITIEPVQSIPMFSDDSIKFYMTYQKEDALSLNTDRRNNDLLSSLLTTVDIMEQGDKVGVFYNFAPCEQIGWRSKYDNTIKKLKDDQPIDKDKLDVWYIFKLLLFMILNLSDIVIECISGEVKKPIIKREMQLQPATFRKRDERVVQTQILCMSESENKRRAYNNALSACEAFQIINQDNQLIKRPCKVAFEPNKTRLNGVETIRVSPKEGQNFIALPGKELINEHKINCIDVLETSVPKELQTGVINIGYSTYKGNRQETYLCNDKEMRNLSLCVVGANRSGKTTLMSNLIDDALQAGECCLIFDYCGQCELSNHLQALFPDKTFAVDCADIEHLQGLGYNEINSNETDTFKQYRNAKMQAVQLMVLLNSINDDDKSLKAKMDRYLEAASLITFISGGSVKDVFNVLQNHEVRQYFISKIPLNQHENLEEYIDSLSELNEYDKKTGELIGTKYTNVTGIFDRLSVLKKNTYLELMLKKDCSNNVNLAEQIQKNQIICIKMPEDMFSTEIEKDVYCTYWFTKIWLSLQLRKADLPRDQHIKVNMFIDELYQIPKCQDLIASKLSQMPKFTAKMIVSCHYLSQIPVMRQELKASNSSYMLLQGSHVSNFDDLKAEFENHDFSKDDLLNLKRYHSLNLISYEKGYWAGVTALPKPKRNLTT